MADGLAAALLLAVAALRLFQPRQHEPSRTIWLLSEWSKTHIAHLGAAALFLAMPGIVVAVGCLVLTD